MNKKELEDFKDIHISYKTAVLAKQKHFYCICPHRFIKENTIIGGWLGDAKAQPTKEDVENYINNVEAYPIASTQQILREWLEEEKNLSVVVIPELKGKETVYAGCIVDKLQASIKMLPTHFSKYSEAMEDGLFNALQ